MSAADEWMSTRDVAALLGVSEATVYRSVKTPEVADRKWGAGNWRRKPLTERAIFQILRSAAEAQKDSRTGPASPSS